MPSESSSQEDETSSAPEPELTSESEESSVEETSSASSEIPSSSEYSSKEESESSIEESSSSEASSSAASSSATVISRTLVLDANNGKINGSYSDSEQIVTATASDGSTIEIGYVTCMGKEGYFAQVKKSAGRVYNLTPLGGITSICVTFETSDALYLSTYSDGDDVSDGNKITSGAEIAVSGKDYFRLTAGRNVVYIKSIEIVCGGTPVTSSSSSSSQASSSSSSTWSSASSSSGTYYDSISSTSTGATLKTALHNLIDNHTNRGYDFAYEAYKTTDVDDSGKIIDVYSSYRWDPERDHQGASGKSNYTKEGDLFNREHTVPQSIFNEASPMKADLHHLLPTDGYVNNRRSNYPHAEVTNVKYTSTNGCKLGTSSVSGYSGNAFEVIDEYKGDIARIYFYMVTRYQDRLTSWSNFAAFSKDTYPSLSSWAKELYLKWSDMDPVSEKEIKRNEAIYKYQGNRNPFVDHPEYAHRIWG